MVQRCFTLTACMLVASLSLMAQGRISMQSKDSVVTKMPTQRVLAPYSIIVRGGLTQFFGELNNQDMKFMVGASLRRRFSPTFSMTFDYTAGKLGGDKEEFYNSYFLTEYNTIALVAHWDITEQLNRQLINFPFHFSVYGGLGIIYFRANAYDLNTNELVRFSNSDLSRRTSLFLRWGTSKGPLGIERTQERTIPLGTTLSYQLSNSWKIGLDYRFYFVRNDKLDATSGRSLANPEESASYSDTPNDMFSFLSGTVSYRFTRKPKDADEDGIPDDRDRCPDTPGSARFFGCPDTDNDGIPDYVDRCPTVAGPVATRGCPDTDGDGFVDRLDECPQVAGTLNGCPDRDGDGVKDEFDGCPDVPGLFRFGGCPDTDGDGIPDQVDKCPDKPGKYENGGCPVE